MRKSILLLGAPLLLTAFGANAADAEPKVVNDCLVSVTSPNGMMGVSDDDMGTIIIIDYKGDMAYIYPPEMEAMPDGSYLVTKSYSKGMGNCISDNGIVLANTTEAYNDGSYWDNGTWKSVARPANASGLLQLNGITADGSRICGISGVGSTDADAATMATPVLWKRGADGAYNDYVMLPVPEVDFTGRAPQMITAVSISADGKTIAGQVWDYYGARAEPIVYLEDAEGNWSYKLVDLDFYDHDWPELPGEPPVVPEPFDFMTESEIAAYNAAVDAYNNAMAEPEPTPQEFMTSDEWKAYQEAYNAWNPEDNPFPPSPTDFMTPDEVEDYNLAVQEYWASRPEYPMPEGFMSPSEYQAYADAVEAYNTEFFAWWEKQNTFMEEYFDFINVLPAFDNNNVFLSPDGRYYATTSIVDYVATPYRFDLQKNDYELYNEDVLLSYVNNDGVLMGGYPMMEYSRTAKILDGTDGNFIDAYTYINDRNASLGKWISQNCPTIGTPSGAQDLGVIWGWTYFDRYYTNILPVAKSSGIGAIGGVAPFSFKAERGGAIVFTGEARNIVVFDTKGVKVFSAENPAARVETGLSAGTYIVKTTSTDGQMIVGKLLIP